MPIFGNNWPDEAPCTGPAANETARTCGDRSIAITELAAKCAMSPRTFFRRFTEQMGMSPSAWMQGERIARARAMLESGHLNLDQISAQCGYDSPETFRVAFKRVTRISPGQYRRRYMGASATP